MDVSLGSPDAERVNTEYTHTSCRRSTSVLRRHQRPAHRTTATAPQQRLPGSQGCRRPPCWTRAWLVIWSRKSGFGVHMRTRARSPAPRAARRGGGRGRGEQHGEVDAAVRVQHGSEPAVCGAVPLRREHTPVVHRLCPPFLIHAFHVRDGAGRTPSLSNLTVSLPPSPFRLKGGLLFAHLSF